MSVEPALVVEDLVVGHGRSPVLRVGRAVAARERITAVVGPNAAGKSTLLRTLSGALRPIEGSVRIGGRDPRTLHGRALAEAIVYVAQRPTLAARFLVREVVALGRHALPASAGRVREAMAAVGAADIADRPFDAISVGQQQRTMLARALAQAEPGAVLLLDEPTSAMDLRASRRAMAAVREIVSRGAAALVAAHDLHAVRGWADDAWLLADGALVAAGDAAAVLAPEPLEAAFGVPFARIALPGGGETVLPAPPAT